MIDRRAYVCTRVRDLDHGARPAENGLRIDGLEIALVHMEPFGEHLRNRGETQLVEFCLAAVVCGHGCYEGASGILLRDCVVNESVAARFGESFVDRLLVSRLQILT